MGCAPVRRVRMHFAHCIHLIRISHLTAFVVAYVVLFLIANVVVLKAYWENRQRELDELRRFREMAQLRRRPLGGADAFLQRLQNTVGRGRRHQVFRCSDFPTLSVGRRLGFGWSKEVFSATFENRSAAVKTVNVEGRDMSVCQTQGENYTVCYQRTAEKMYEEVKLLHQLRHPNIIELYGFCMSLGRGEDSVVAMVTELGQPLHQLALLQLAWEWRLRLALDAARLLEYLAASPLGPAGLTDLRLEQFVTAAGRLKLTDLDDVIVTEPRCETGQQCVLPPPAAALPVLCAANRCQGFNSRRNQMLAAKQLFEPLLRLGAPPHMNSTINDVIRDFRAANRSASEMRRRTEHLVDLFKQKGYGFTNVNGAVYEPVWNATLLGHNYRCPLSAEPGVCSLSVSGPREAEAVCSADRRCEGFVLTNSRTWTGRRMSHFKTRIVTGEVTREVNSTLYIRQMTRR